MDFGFSEQEERFRQEVHEFLEKEVLPDWSYEGMRAEGSGAWSIALRRQLGQKGWIGLDWPKEYGGSGRTLIEKYILREELSYFHVPVLGVAGTVAGPIILEVGTEEQKKEYIPPIARGDIEFALGYTEAEAGSDLAALDIRAVDNGDHYLVNGHKMFNTNCHYAEYHWLAARTDPEARKHKGISLFVVDLKSPGLSLSPLITMSGARTNIVYYDNVRVPKENLVGQKNRGFYHILSALDRERLLCMRDLERVLEDLVGYVKRTTRNGLSLGGDPIIRSRLAELAIEVKAARLLAHRVAWLYSKGKVPVYETSMSKVFGDELRQRLANIGMQILGRYGQIQRSSKYERLGGMIELWYRVSPFLTLSAGTSEIMRNTIATRGLGLPRE